MNFYFKEEEVTPLEDQEYTIDLMEVAAILSENRKPIAKITGVFVLLAILYLLIAPP